MDPRDLNTMELYRHVTNDVNTIVRYEEMETSKFLGIRTKTMYIFQDESRRFALTEEEVRRTIYVKPS